MSGQQSAERSADDEDRPRGGVDVAPPSHNLDAILDEFEERYRAGRPVRSEDFLEELESDDDRVALVYHEYSLLEDEGKPVDVDRFLGRFPLLEQRLRRMLALHELVDPVALVTGCADPESVFPRPGGRVGPYRLVRELGRGSFGRVFLAEQSNLEGRLVVLKLSQHASQESELLARLQHPHIVDIVRYGPTFDGVLHMTCMPYLGGATLDAVGRAARGVVARSGKAWLELVDQVSARERVHGFERSASRQIIEGLSFDKAMAYVAARLADALDAAHRRGVVHGDIKPSNILIAADGRPLLLDFNHAFDRTPEQLAHCGTIAYQPPERLRLHEQRARPAGEARPASAGAGPMSLRRGDFYSLGLVLLELLRGRVSADLEENDDRPEAMRRVIKPGELAQGRSDPKTIRAWVSDPRVPVGLRPILARCLAPDPRDRYARGSELAEDLDRFVADRPPTYARPECVRERVWNWARRQKLRIAIAGGMTAGVAVLALVAHLTTEQSLRREATHALRGIWSGRDASTVGFSLPGPWRDPEPNDVIAEATRALQRFRVLDDDRWRDRPGVKYLSDPERGDVELWLLEQMWRLCSALVARGSAADLKRAGHLLALDPDWSRLEMFRSLRETIASRPDAPGEPAPVLPLAGVGRRERVVSAFMSGLNDLNLHARRALGSFRLVCVEYPDSFWANYRAASAAFRIGLYKEADQYLARCLQRVPENLSLMVQRAACLYHLGELDAAERACGRAIEIDPEFYQAYRTRAFIRMSRGQSLSFESDRERVALSGGRTGRFASWELDWLASQLGASPAPPDDEMMRFFESFRSDAIDDAELMFFQGMLHEVAKREANAIALYRQALTRNAGHLAARQRLGMLLFQQGNRTEGVTLLLGVTEHPRFEELAARMPEAIQSVEAVSPRLIREGRMDEADAQLALGFELLDRFETAKHHSIMEAGLLYAQARLNCLRVGALREEELGAAYDANWIREASRALRRALELQPEQVGAWLERDRAFDSVYQEILDAWIEESVVTPARASGGRN